MTRVCKAIFRLLPAYLVIFGYITFQIWLTYHNFFDSSNSQDSLLVVPVDGTKVTETLVVACDKDDDMSWLQRHHFPVAKVTYSRSSKGNEALAYLQYIVDNYNTLSDVTIFIHNQEKAWHNARLFSLRMSRMLDRLDRKFVQEVGYFNLRCEWDPGCPARLNMSKSDPDEVDDRELVAMQKVWPELHPDHPDIPSVLAQPCCSQFAVSRERIRNIPLSRWIHFRDWILLQTDMKNWLIGRLWEYIWQFVLGSQDDIPVTTWCPSERDCYCYGYGVCFDPGDEPGSWGELLVVEREITRLKEEYMVALGRVGKGDVTEDLNKELHGRILAEESKLEGLLEAAIKKGAEGRRWRDASRFRVS